MPQLSLDCLTLTDTPPDQLVRAAGAAGFDLVSLWTGIPIFPHHGVTADNRDAVARALAETGVGVHTIEVFDLVSEEALESYRPALQLGAELGARSATTINFANPDRDDVVRLLHRFAAIAESYGLATSLEPISVGHTRTLKDAAHLIADAGAKVGITFDFLHLVRTGGSAEDVRAIDPALIRYVQVCDGPLEVAPELAPAEGTVARLLPGAGEFPVSALIAASPTHAIFAAECPDLARMQSGATPGQRALEAMQALCSVLPAINHAEA